MGSKAERRAARDAVAMYHERCLAELLEHVSTDIERMHSGELAPWQVDETIFQYSRAAKELWKFCNLGGDVEFKARMINDNDAVVDWWERGAPRRRA